MSSLVVRLAKSLCNTNRRTVISREAKVLGSSLTLPILQLESYDLIKTYRNYLNICILFCNLGLSGYSLSCFRLRIITYRIFFLLKGQQLRNSTHKLKTLSTCISMKTGWLHQLGVWPARPQLHELPWQEFCLIHGDMLGLTLYSLWSIYREDCLYSDFSLF